MEVKGRNFQTGLPQVILINEKDMAEAIQKPLKLILKIFMPHHNDSFASAISKNFHIALVKTMIV